MQPQGEIDQSKYAPPCFVETRTSIAPPHRDLRTRRSRVGDYRSLAVRPGLVLHAPSGSILPARALRPVCSSSWTLALCPRKPRACRTFDRASRRLEVLERCLGVAEVELHQPAR